MSRAHDIAIVGGGIVGCATAYALLESRPGLRVTVLEKEDKLAAHQTGHNSGVIHSGLYYKPGSLKATLCVRGRTKLEHFCDAHGVAYDKCGKIVVATRPEQLAQLDAIEARGRANGLVDMRRLAAAEIAEHEPRAAGLAALFVPETGIVDYRRVVDALGAAITARGGEIARGARFDSMRREGGEIILETTGGAHRCRALVNCAGLHSDRVARACGVASPVRIVPFRGEYYALVAGRESLVKNLIYPVPNPAFPFLGVHFTRMIGGGVEAGPNAVLALKREGYKKTSLSVRDAASALSFPGFWRMAAKYWRTGAAEMWRSWSKAAFARALMELVPDIREEDLVPAGAGVRAQALDRHGGLVDDFVIEEGLRMVHVLNAPSPAATASLAIAEHVATRALASLE